MLTLKDLQYFESVARLKSVSRAAREQFVSQPAVSLSLRKIETYFNTDLFLRTPNALDLTQAGLELYPLVKNLLKLQNELFAVATTNQIYNSINIAILPFPLYKSIFYLAKILFNQRYPDIEINIHEYSFDTIPDDLKSYFFICFSPEVNHSKQFFNELRHQLPHLKATEIMTDHFCLVCNQEYQNTHSSKCPTKIGTLFSIESLKNMPIYDEKKTITHLKNLGFICDNKSIVYLDPSAYDDILNRVLSDNSCFALLPQNFIRPYENYFEFLTAIDLNLFTTHHYIAYNQIAFNQFSPAQFFLKLLFDEVQKYT